MKKNIVFHPFLFGIFPIIFLYFHNKYKLPFEVVFLPLIIVFSLTLLVWVLVQLYVKNWEKAGLIVTFFFILFFSYGFWLNKIKGFKVWHNFLGNLLVLLPIFGFIFFIGLKYLLRTKKNYKKYTKILNAMGIFLIVFNISINSYYYFNRPVTDKLLIPPISKIDKKPDIYYIIFDSYARNDILKSLYNFNNKKLLGFLESKNFYIATQSLSNYAYTELSIASSLNFTYLNDIINQSVINKDDLTFLGKIIRENRISAFLKQNGYNIYTFSSGHSLTEIKNSDKYYSPRWNLSDFSNILINSTPVSTLISSLQNKVHKNRINFIFNKLQEISKDESPKFVFAHVYAPHPPFVFSDNDKDFCSPSEFSLEDPIMMPAKDYIRCYVDQLKYLNTMIEDSIDSIIRYSRKSPIIILQGDHGSRSTVFHNTPYEFNTIMSEVMSIFFAVYLPENNCENLYSSITPVNIFRIILDCYFGTNLGLLDDRSYYSEFGNYYQFYDVTNKVRSRIE